MKSINSKLLQEVGHQIRKRREELAYALNDVASMTGLTINTIFLLEKGNGATLNNFLLICRALNIQPKAVFQQDIELNPLFELSPESKHKIELSQKLDRLVYNSDFFKTPRRVAEVIKELEYDKAESNKFSVYLTGYCKEGELEYIKEGNYKRYLKKH